MILERSPLGTGKTTAMKDFLDRYKFKKALFMSPRTMFANNIYGEFQKYGFEHYKEKEGDLSKVNRLICSLESLRRISNPVILPNNVKKNSNAVYQYGMQVLHITSGLYTVNT